MSFAPLHPSGWPRAMAPPFTLTFSWGTPCSAIQAMGTGAKASLHSKRSMSSIDMPDFSRAYAVAGMGPVSMKIGSSPRTLMWWMRARGVRPWSATACSEATSRAAAPSLVWLASAAVIRPPSTRGASWAIFSMLPPLRGPSSCSTPASGATSGWNRPSSIAVMARSWLVRAKASISSREMSHFSAISSAPRNWETSWVP